MILLTGDPDIVICVAVDGVRYPSLKDFVAAFNSCEWQMFNALVTWVWAPEKGVWMRMQKEMAVQVCTVVLVRELDPGVDQMPEDGAGDMAPDVVPDWMTDGI